MRKIKELFYRTLTIKIKSIKDNQSVVMINGDEFWLSNMEGGEPPLAIVNLKLGFWKSSIDLLINPNKFYKKEK